MFLVLLSSNSETKHKNIKKRKQFLKTTTNLNKSYTVITTIASTHHPSNHTHCSHCPRHNPLQSSPRPELTHANLSSTIVGPISMPSPHAVSFFRATSQDYTATRCHTSLTSNAKVVGGSDDVRMLLIQGGSIYGQCCVVALYCRVVVVLIGVH